MIHFSREEFSKRQKKAVSAVVESGLEALLLFAPESQYWISGYDTFGFAMFQCMVLTAKGELHLLTRAPDLRQALHTSTLTQDQIHIWREIEGANPAVELVKLLQELEIRGPIGFEGDTAGLTDFNGQILRKSCPNLIEASKLLRALRREKSPAEILMHRRAAALSDDALDAATDLLAPGAFEGDILAAMQGAVFEGGGDYAGNEFIIASGKGALLVRYFSGRRYLASKDQLTLEWSGAFARYHAAMMRTLIVGQPTYNQQKMHEAAVEALEACEEAIRPDAPMGDVFEAHVRVLDKHNLRHARLQACGYAMGAVYNPIWVEFPMFYESNPLPMKKNQVFFLHMILLDDASGEAMTLGHSILVGKNGNERLSRNSLKLIYRA